MGAPVSAHFYWSAVDKHERPISPNTSSLRASSLLQPSSPGPSPVRGRGKAPRSAGEGLGGRAYLCLDARKRCSLARDFGLAVAEHQAKAAPRDYIFVFGVGFFQPLAEPAHQRVNRLVGHFFVRPPDVFAQILAGDDSAFVLDQQR